MWLQAPAGQRWERTLQHLIASSNPHKAGYYSQDCFLASLASSIWCATGHDTAPPGPQLLSAPNYTFTRLSCSCMCPRPLHILCCPHMQGPHSFAFTVAISRVGKCPVTNFSSSPCSCGSSCSAPVPVDMDRSRHGRGQPIPRQPEEHQQQHRGGDAADPGRFCSSPQRAGLPSAVW